MKLVTALFLAILIALHYLAGQQAAALPLSMFRDGRFAALGYLAFLTLIVIGLLMVHASHRSGQNKTAVFYAVATVLLLVLAATPSWGPFHVFWSLVLPLLFYVYYTRLLLGTGSVWVPLHLAIPVVLVLATRYHSFGAWQKSLIAYFLLVVNIHYHILWHLGPSRPRVRRRVSSLRKRVIYVVGELNA
jgi:hypothetical protein